MSVGFWVTPIVMVGLSAFLFLANWLERLVPPPSDGAPASPPTLETVGAELGATAQA